nr:MAG TPA: hypothetical protein [Caudoviricetes sp.]
MWSAIADSSAVTSLKRNPYPLWVGAVEGLFVCSDVVGNCRFERGHFLLREVAAFRLFFLLFRGSESHHDHANNGADCCTSNDGVVRDELLHSIPEARLGVRGLGVLRGLSFHGLGFDNRSVRKCDKHNRFLSLVHYSGCTTCELRAKVAVPNPRMAQHDCRCVDFLRIRQQFMQFPRSLKVSPTFGKSLQGLW